MNSIVKIFADDIKTYNKDSNSDIIQQDLDALYTWAQIWQLRFNVKKCKTVHYGKNNQVYQYTMNFEDIETASEEKDLGVTFQQDLKFSSHIAEKVNKANSILSLIVRTFDYLEKVSKGAKIRNRYNQVPHLTQDTNGKVTNSQLDTTNESQEVSPFPAGDHKAHIHRRTQRHSKHKTEQKHKRSTKEVPPWNVQ